MYLRRLDLVGLQELRRRAQEEERDLDLATRCRSRVDDRCGCQEAYRGYDRDTGGRGRSRQRMIVQCMKVPDQESVRCIIFYAGFDDAY